MGAYEFIKYSVRQNKSSSLKIYKKNLFKMGVGGGGGGRANFGMILPKDVTDITCES